MSWRPCLLVVSEAQGVERMTGCRPLEALGVGGNVGLCCPLLVAAAHSGCDVTT